MPGMQVSLFSIEECCDSSGLPSGPQGAQAGSAGGGPAQREEHEKSAAEGLSDLAWSGEVHLYLSECVRSQLFGSARVSGGQQNLLRDLCNSMRSLRSDKPKEAGGVVQMELGAEDCCCLIGAGHQQFRVHHEVLVLRCHNLQTFAAGPFTYVFPNIDAVVFRGALDFIYSGYCKVMPRKCLCYSRAARSVAAAFAVVAVLSEKRREAGLALSPPPRAPLSYRGAREILVAPWRLTLGDALDARTAVHRDQLRSALVDLGVEGFADGDSSSSEDEGEDEGEDAEDDAEEEAPSGMTLSAGNTESAGGARAGARAPPPAIPPSMMLGHPFFFAQMSLPLRRPGTTLQQQHESWPMNQPGQLVPTISPVVTTRRLKSSAVNSASAAAAKPAATAATPFAHGGGYSTMPGFMPNMPLMMPPMPNNPAVLLQTLQAMMMTCPRKQPAAIASRPPATRLDNKLSGSR